MITGLVITSFITSLISLILALWAIIDVLATKRSSHKIQYVGNTDKVEVSEDLPKSMSIDELNKKFNREAFSDLPFFSQDTKNKRAL